MQPRQQPDRPLPSSPVLPSTPNASSPLPTFPSSPKPRASPRPSGKPRERVPDASLLPLAPLPTHLAPFLQPASPLSPEEKRTLFTSTFLRSASSGHSDTLEWLLSVGPDSASSSTSAAARRFSSSSLSSHNQKGEDERAEALLPDDAPRKWVDIEARDEDGNSALGLCVALGHAEGVRVIVEGGASVSGGDNAGWTPLHWAAQNNDVAIAAYLVNHRAPPSVASHKGLTPKDLCKLGKEGAALRDVLRSAEEAIVMRERQARTMEEGDEAADSRGLEDRPSSRASSVASSSRPPGWTLDKEKVEEETRERNMLRRLELAKASVRALDVDMGILSLTEKTDGELHDEDEDDEDDQLAPFEWSRCLPDQMLVFTLDDLPIIFDVVISNMKPVRARKYRVTPANVVFLCARYAHYHGSVDLVDELFLTAIERIEAAVHNRPDDMTNCAFWLSNCFLLLYCLRKEPNLYAATDDYQTHLSDLINEIFVFVIRDAERRIDRILEAAFLEHESLPGFEDVQFEGDWSSNRFVKKLTGRAKKTMAKSISSRSLFADTAASASNSPPSAVPSPAEPATPRHITALLSSTLFVLQLYEIPPSIIVQAFSQLFYWVSCEIFNRLLVQKKYLCRSKAMQIRLNVTTLEDWARQNRMPSKMVSVHFTPLNQMLQWLQCLSSESAIDGLIGTIQSLRALNPLQLRRAVREYRYEVSEPKMGEDCEQYLIQIQKQWGRLRVQKTVDELESAGGSQRSASPNGSSSQASVHSDVARMIDEIFSDPSSFGHYSPPGGTEALGELLNSRYMLPFAVPSSAEMLVNFRSKDAFGPFASPYPQADDGASTPRSFLNSPSSQRRSSAVVANGAFSRLSQDASETDSSAGSSWSDPEDDQRFVPILPAEFFAVLDAVRVEAYRTQGPSHSHFHSADGLRFEGDSGTDPGAVGAGGLFDWRANMPSEEPDDEEDGRSDGQSELGYERTPRPRTGFVRNVSGRSSMHEVISG